MNAKNEIVNPPLSAVAAEASALARATPRDQLRKFLERQPDPVIYLLADLMYLGRGDFSPARLLNSLAYLRSGFPKSHWAVSQMTGKTQLPEYLEKGVMKLRQAGVDVGECGKAVMAKWPK